MEIIGITTCVNYAPLLKLGLIENSKLLKHIYVITREDDDETREACDQYANVTLITYDFKIDISWFDIWARRYELGHAGMPPPQKSIDQIKRLNTRAFNKGGGLRLGQLSAEQDFPDDFYLILDCDVVLTKDILTAFQIAPPQKDVLYGVKERRDYNCLKDYQNKTNYTVYEKSQGGWGFFQLYKNSRSIYYDDWHTAAATDKWFKEDIIKGDYGNLVILDSYIEHLGEEGASIFLQDFNFKE